MEKTHLKALQLTCVHISWSAAYKTTRLNESDVLKYTEMTKYLDMSATFKNFIALCDKISNQVDLF